MTNPPSESFPYRGLSRNILSHLYHNIDNLPEQDLPYFAEVLSCAYHLINNRYPMGEGLNQSPEGQPPEELESLTILTLGVLASHFIKNEQSILPQPESVPFHE